MLWKIVAPSDVEATLSDCCVALAAGGGDDGADVVSVTLGGAAVIGDGFVPVDCGAAFVADGFPGAVAMWTGGAGATVSVAVAAVDIEPGVIVVALSVGTAVVAGAGAAELVAIVDVVSFVDVVVVSWRPHDRATAAVQAARTIRRERTGAAFY